MPIEITQKSTQNRQTVVDLKRDRDIGRKAVLNDVKTAFTCTPASKLGYWKLLHFP